MLTSIKLLSDITQTSQNKEILAMAHAYSHDLLKRATDQKHPMFALHRAVCLTDLAVMLDSRFKDRLGTEAMVTLVDEQVIGFIVYTKAINCDEACGINYICVREEYRNLGIMSDMLGLLRKL